MLKFDWSMLTEADRKLAKEILGYPEHWANAEMPEPGLVIAPAGEDKPYLYRWHLVRTEHASVYFHIQVADDPERPLHDHPADNTSVILSGGYDELLDEHPGRTWINTSSVQTLKRRAGDVIHRKAEWAHRLLLPPGFGYTMTLFMFGPKRREWGFWYPDGWRPYAAVTETHDGVSVHVKPTMEG